MKLRYPIRDLHVMEKRKTYIPHLLVVLLGWSMVMTWDYRDQKLHAEEVARKLDTEFAECLRGEWREVTEQGVHLGCLPVQRWDPKNRTTGVKK